MALDPFIHPDTEIQALLQLTGVCAWKLWGPNQPRSEVYLTLTTGLGRCTGKITWNAPVDLWREALAGMLDKTRPVEA